MPAALRALLRLFLRIFFRRIELTGIDRVPRDGPLVLVLNHPNALIDPLFVLCLAPRPVSFLAKAPLFRMPLVGWMVRAAGSIPVERRQDPGADLSRNRAMFERVRAHLAAGGAVALFPEGTSHSDPRLKPLKSGAARIALGVRAAEPVRIQPVGLFYTAKETFRSAALVAFGEPFPVAPAPLDDAGEPPAPEVDALTARIAEALAALTLQADATEVLELVGRTEAILAGPDAEAPGALARRVDLRRRLLEGHRRLAAVAPERLERLRRRVLRYEARMHGAGLDPWALPDSGHPFAAVLAATLALLIRFVTLLPLGLAGLVIHYPAYRAIGLLAARLGPPQRESHATAKIVTAFLMFPITWAVLAWLVASRAGWAGAVATLVLLPVAGWSALRLSELWDHVIGATRSLTLFLLGRRRFLHLKAERQDIREDFGRIAEELERT